VKVANILAEPSTVVHGDQNINYGTAGAIGTRSTGTINFQQQWSSLERSVNLRVLATQVDYLRTAYTPEPGASRSHARTAGFLAEAEEHAEYGDGSKTMEALSKVGGYMLDFAKEVGTDLAAKVMAKPWVSIPRQVDVLPAERRQVLQQFGIQNCVRPQV
jgi:hypothetical protein